MEYTCKICWNSENNSLYTVKEIIIGNGDEFEYIECSRCGCLQIAEIPKNLARYYEGYYSLGAVDDKNITRIQKFISDSFEKSKIYYYTKKGGIIARSICWFFPELMPPPPPREPDIFYKKILDVGCGTGWSLSTLAKAGFKNLSGCDLFIEKDIVINEADNVTIKIHKCEIYDIAEKFDIITLSHSLEHMPEQEKVLSKINSLLNDGGICIIDIPTVSCYAWKKYKESWYSISAPVHFFLHSMKSINILAENCGFIIGYIVHNSIKGLLLNKYYSKGYNSDDIIKKLGSIKGIIPFIYDKLQAKWLNKKKLSDCVRICLRKTKDFVEICEYKL